MSLNNIFRKCSGGHKLHELQQQPPKVYGQYQIVCEKWKKELEALIQEIRIHSDDRGIEFGINGKWQKEENLKLRKNENDRRKRNG